MSARDRVEDADIAQPRWSGGENEVPDHGERAREQQGCPNEGVGGRAAAMQPEQQAACQSRPWGYSEVGAFAEVLQSTGEYVDGRVVRRTAGEALDRDS